MCFFYIMSKLCSYIFIRNIVFPSPASPSGGGAATLIAHKKIESMVTNFLQSMVINPLCSQW